MLYLVFKPQISWKQIEPNTLDILIGCSHIYAHSDE